MAGNRGSARCWGTNLTGGYVADTDALLRTPVINLEGVVEASLTFAGSLDADAGHTFEVNVIEDGSDTIIANLVPATGDSDINNSNWQGIGPIALPAAALGRSIRIEWRFTGNGDGSFNGVYLDDVTLSETSP